MSLWYVKFVDLLIQFFVSVGLKQTIWLWKKLWNELLRRFFSIFSLSKNNSKKWQVGNSFFAHTLTAKWPKLASGALNPRYSSCKIKSKVKKLEFTLGMFILGMFILGMGKLQVGYMIIESRCLQFCETSIQWSL